MKQLISIEAKTEFYNYIKPLKKVTPASEQKFSYHFLTRQKKSQPWKCEAFVYVAGDCCSVVANDYFEANGYKVKHPFSCIVDGRTWHKFQVTQHLRLVKMNIKR